MFDTRNEIVVFTDGAAKGNPGPGGWGVVIVSLDDRVTELGGGAAHTTNNRMELAGAIAALERVAGESGPVTIYTDSSYVIKGITQWVWSWQRRGWKTAEGGDVLNRELWEQLSSLVNARGRNRIAWHWVRGHDGVHGNERVDRIAVAFSHQLAPELYLGAARRLWAGHPGTAIPAGRAESLVRQGLKDRGWRRGAGLSQPRRRAPRAARDVGRMRASGEGTLGRAFQESGEHCGRSRGSQELGPRSGVGPASRTARIVGGCGSRRS